MMTDAEFLERFHLVADPVLGTEKAARVADMVMNMEALDDDIKIWLADYNDSVTYSGAYQFHQFTKQGQIDGINSKQVDLNYWYAES